MKPLEITTDGVILQVLTGSRAYGLDTPESDYDYHGVYVTPTSELVAIGRDKKSRIWDENPKQDTVQWELGHFLFESTKCNPTMLETFVGPVEFVTDYGDRLRRLFPLVLARKRLYEACLGYAHNQQKKMFDKPDSPTETQPSERAWKFAVQYLRVLIQGEHLLRSGQFELNMHTLQARDYLMEVRRGEHSMGEVIDRATIHKMRLELAFVESKVREEPDFDAVNKFLIEVRKEVW